MADRASLGAEAEASRGGPRPVCACRVSTLVPNDANARVFPRLGHGERFRTRASQRARWGTGGGWARERPLHLWSRLNSEAEAKPAIGRVFGDPLPDGRGTPGVAGVDRVLP